MIDGADGVRNGHQRLGLGAARLLATGFGCGYLRPVPGTVGSAVGLVTFALLLSARSLRIQVGAALLLTGLAIVVAHVWARHLGEEDPSEIVVDEIAGIWWAVLGTSTWGIWLLAFVLFRLFDIVKPFPARSAERLPGGLGIVADDLVAGCYGGLCAWILVALWTSQTQG